MAVFAEVRNEAPPKQTLEAPRIVILRPGTQLRADRSSRLYMARAQLRAGHRVLRNGRRIGFQPSAKLSLIAKGSSLANRLVRDGRRIVPVVGNLPDRKGE